MAKLHFTDIVAMAKSGWTPDAVNSMLDRFEEINSKDESDDHEEESHEGEENSPGDESDSPDDESDQDEKDKEIAALKAQVEQLQKDNSHQNNDSGEKKTLDDLVDDIFREFYD